MDGVLSFRERVEVYCEQRVVWCVKDGPIWWEESNDACPYLRVDKSRSNKFHITRYEFLRDAPLGEGPKAHIDCRAFMAVAALMDDQEAENTVVDMFHYEDTLEKLPKDEEVTVPGRGFFFGGVRRGIPKDEHECRELAQQWNALVEEKEDHASVQILDVQQLKGEEDGEHVPPLTSDRERKKKLQMNIAFQEKKEGSPWRAFLPTQRSETLRRPPCSVMWRL